MGTLENIARAIHRHQVVGELVRDPDPEPKHEYESDPQSGAGSCVCGAAEHHRRHPHEFRPAASQPELCVCGLPADARCHRGSQR